MATCTSGCPTGVDLRTCKKMMAGECPMLVSRMGALFIGDRQQSLFN